MFRLRAHSHSRRVLIWSNSWAAEEWGENITHLEILLGAMWESILLKRLVCTQNNQWKHINLRNILMTLYVNMRSNHNFFIKSKLRKKCFEWKWNNDLYLSEVAVCRYSVKKLILKFLQILRKPSQNPILVKLLDFNF